MGGLLISACFQKKQSVSYDPLRDGWPGLYDHWLFACAYGNRERFYDDDGVVEMFFSFFNVFTTKKFASCGEPVS
jgi:hypothetical protein